jgi:hypothetical protein
VKRFKHTVSSAANSFAFFEAVLSWNNTSIADNLPSPAEIHFGHSLCSGWTCNPRQCVTNWAELKLEWERIREKQKTSYDLKAKPLLELAEGDRVLVWHLKRWNPGKIKMLSPNPQGYFVSLDSGIVIERNRVKIRKVEVKEFDGPKSFESSFNGPISRSRMFDFMSRTA